MGVETTERPSLDGVPVSPEKQREAERHHGTDEQDDHSDSDLSHAVRTLRGRRPLPEIVLWNVGLTHDAVFTHHRLERSVTPDWSFSGERPGEANRHALVIVAGARIGTSFELDVPR